VTPSSHLLPFKRLFKILFPFKRLSGITLRVYAQNFYQVAADPGVAQTFVLLPV
jgi:hypothetical protein